jgi:hypothetical protein
MANGEPVTYVSGLFVTHFSGSSLTMQLCREVIDCVVKDGLHVVRHRKG